MTASGAARQLLAAPGDGLTYHGGGGGGAQHRYMRRIVGRGGRRSCYCGCLRRCSHLGMADGVCLMSGCEWSVRQWVRDPEAGVRRSWERYDEAQLAKSNGAVRCATEDCAVCVRRPVGWTLARTRKALREDRGWTCDKRGDFCPDHRP
jgi:hypothetical protein